MLQVLPRYPSGTIDGDGQALRVIMTSKGRQASTYVVIYSPVFVVRTSLHLSRSTSPYLKRSFRTSDANDATYESERLCSQWYKGYGEPRYWNFEHVLVILVYNISHIACKGIYGSTLEGAAYRGDKVNLHYTPVRCGV